MYVNVIGETKKRTKILENLIHYSADLLFKNKINIMSKLDIMLTIRKVDNDEAFKGFVEILDNKKIPKNFEIIIDKSLQFKDRVLTIAHEMVHVKQYALRELVLKNPTEHFWNNKLYRDIENLNNYWDLPWEIEAYGKEKGIVVRFLEEYGYCHYSWARQIW